MADYTPTTDEVREDFAYPWEGHKQDREGRLAAFGRWLAQNDAEVAAKAQTLPDVFSGCVCTGYSEDRGGGYSEHVVEYEPACPEHSEHVYDPLQGMWILRTEVPVKPERPVDPWVDRIETEGSKG